MPESSGPVDGGSALVDGGTELGAGSFAAAVVDGTDVVASGEAAGSSEQAAVDVTFGEASELVVTVTNDGNVTMDDITSTLEFNGADGPVEGEADDCEYPELSPDESADCTVEFTPTEDMTDVVVRVVGYGPQDQEVAWI